MGFGGYLQANTAVDVLIGPFIDDTDGKTAETALTLSQADIKLSKNGQALTQKNDDTAAAHDANGYYNCELNATDTNTEGTLTLIVHETGALPVRHDFMVLSQAAYTSLVTAKDAGYMDVNVKAISEDTTAPDNLELMYDGTGYAGGTTKLDVNVVTIAANAITATAINADAITNAKIADNAIAAENLAADCITSAKIADNAFANEHFADGALTSTEITSAAGCIVASIANNAITAAAIATDAIDADALKADALAEIADAVWDEASTGHTDAGKAGAQLWTVLDDVPNTSEFQARTIPAADYTVVSDLGTVQTGDSFAIVNGDHGLVSIQDDIDAIKAKTDSLTFTVAGDVDCNVQTWKGSAAQDMTGDSYARLGAPAGASVSADIAAVKAETAAILDDTPTAIAEVKTVVDLVEDILRNKMEITDANGNLVLYEDDGTTPKYSVNACVTDDATTTIRKRLE